MNKSETIRENLHKIINKVENDELLEVVYQILESNKLYPEGSLIKTLKAEEKEELYKSFDESLDDSNLTKLDEVKKKHSKWLGE